MNRFYQWFTLSNIAISARREVKKLATRNIGAGLRACRVKAELTQQQLSDALGRDFTYVSKVENGKIIPDADTYNLWIEITNSEVMMFTYIHGENNFQFAVMHAVK